MTKYTINNFHTNILYTNYDTIYYVLFVTPVIPLSTKQPSTKYNT